MDFGQKATIFLILFCLALPVRGNVEFEGISDSCGFSCWIGNLTINIPNINAAIDGFNFTVAGMTCSQMTIGGLNSSFIPPTSISFFPNGIGLACFANWSFQEEGFPYLYGSGTVNVTISDSSLLLGIKLLQDNNTLVKAAEVFECSTSLNVSSIVFSDSNWAYILDLFEGVIIDQINSGIDGVACTQLTQIIQNNATILINEINKNITPYLTPPPPPIIPPIPGIVTLDDNSIVSLATLLIQDTLNPQGILSINDLIERFLHINGTMEFTPEQLEQLIVTAPISNLGSLTFGFLNLTITGLNTFGPLDVSAENYLLLPRVEIQNLTINATVYFNVTNNSSTIFGEGLYEECLVTISTANVSLNATVELLIDQAIQFLAGNQLEEVGCLLKNLNEVKILTLFLEMVLKEANIVAIGGDVEKEIDATLDNILKLATSAFGPAIPAFINAYGFPPALNLTNNFLGNFTHQLFQEFSYCPAGAPPPPTFNIEGAIIGMGATGAISSMIVFIAAMLQIRNFVEKRRRKFPENSPLLNEKQIQDFHVHEKDNSEPALIFHKKIPLIVRYGMVFLFLGNIGLFIASNSSVGADVFIVLQVNNTRVELPSLFSFSLVNSVRDMWTAGVYALSLLIAVFSGAWPYIKLLIMLLCWLTPPSKLSVNFRENLLLFVDKLGKWSLIDAYVLILMMVAFRFHLVSPIVQNSYVGLVDVYVVPELGFYLFLFAAMLSLTLGHVALGFHEKSVKIHRKKNYEKKDSLANHTFHTQKGKYTCTDFGKSIIVSMLALSIGLIAVGSIVNSFAFSFKGATGFILELDDRDPEMSFSAISLGLFIPESSANPHNFGIKWIQSVYFTFVVAVPLAHLVVMLFLWLTPLSLAVKKVVYVITEVLNAWSAMEVFVISIIAALLEIRQFAQFIVGDKCNLVNQILAQYFDNLVDGDPKCFDVIATLDYGCWILFGACVIYLFVSTIVMKTCYQALHETGEEEEHEALVNSGTKKEMKKGILLRVGDALHVIKT